MSSINTYTQTCDSKVLFKLAGEHEFQGQEAAAKQVQTGKKVHICLISITDTQTHLDTMAGPSLKGTKLGPSCLTSALAQPQNFNFMRNHWTRTAAPNLKKKSRNESILKWI